MTATTANTTDQPLIGRARCPRCGYDLRGAIATWAEQCPLHGACAECGLEFEWADLLSSFRRLPGWCVESAPQYRRLIVKAGSTLLRSHWPWNFWSSLRMSHEMGWRRLVAYLVLLAIAVYSLLAICHGVIAWYNFQSNLQWGRPTTTGLSAAMQAAAAPWWPESPGFVLASWGPSPIESPLELFVRYWMPFWPYISYLVLFQLCCALGFAALPVSRKVAKVRWVHVWRIAAYGIGLMFFPLAITIVASTAAVADVQFLTDALSGLTIVVVFMVLPIYFLWWSVATSRYLKMRHAWGIGLAVWFMAFIAPISAGGLVILVGSLFQAGP